ncbi:MAG: hypothetical protein V2A66_06420 [Pseudomonadota bacterium]
MGRHIDINGLSEDRLIELNHRIIERLKFLSRTRSVKQMGKFNVGDRVWFEGHDGEKIRGIVTRLNIKTASVITSAHRWNVYPRFLHKADEVDTDDAARDIQEPLKLIEFKR